MGALRGPEDGNCRCLEPFSTNALPLALCFPQARLGLCTLFFPFSADAVSSTELENYKFLTFAPKEPQ